PTPLSRITCVLPSWNVIVRTSQLGPHASNATHWKATCPSSLIVALPHEPPGIAPPISTNVAWYVCVEAVAGAASTSITATEARASERLSSFIVVLPFVMSLACPSLPSEGWQIGRAH